MFMILLLLLCLTGYLSAKEPPDVDCVVIDLDYVKCLWNKSSTPVVNYTFSSWYKNDGKDPGNFCTNYLTEQGIRTGCNVFSVDRFKTFFTKLTKNESVSDSAVKEHAMKQRVLLNPPVNLTVKNGSDCNLWFYWNYTKKPQCVESEVRFRTNNNKWEKSDVRTAIQHFCINLPSSKSQYELQVRSRFGNNCGQSLFWSDWSEPVVWGSNNSTNPIQKDGMTSVWSIVLYVLGPITLIILVAILLYHERIRIIPVPVPKQSTVLHDIEDWLRLPNVMKDNFKANYNEHACPVREYSHVSQSDSESSDGSTSSVTTDQTDCSVFIPVNQSEDLSTPSSSSSNEGLGSYEEEQHPSV